MRAFTNLKTIVGCFLLCVIEISSASCPDNIYDYYGGDRRDFRHIFPTSVTLIGLIASRFVFSSNQSTKSMTISRCSWIGEE